MVLKVKEKRMKARDITKFIFIYIFFISCAIIVDMNNMNLTQFIIPTGESGQQNSPHYLDQAHLYNKGLYRTTYMDENFIRTSNLFKHLILRPKR